MLVTKTIQKKWISNTRKYYESLGYQFTNYFDTFEVDVNDLTKGSTEIVTVKCDYCGKKYTKQYKQYFKCHDDILGDCCSACKMVKCKDTWMKKYGVEHPFQDKEIQEKRKNTWIEHYGTDNPFKSEKIKDKIKQSNKEIYGVEHVSQSKEIRAKIAQTNLQNFGVANVSQSDIIKEKKKQTCMNNFGVEYPMMSEDVRRKSTLSMYTNGTTPTSKPQLKLFNKLKDMYGNCELNYPCDKYSLDCMVILDDYKIDVEYDGQFFHSRKRETDIIRNDIVMQNGYKILRVKGNYKIPSEEQLQEAIDYLVKGNHSYTEILLDIKNGDMV